MVKARSDRSSCITGFGVRMSQYCTSVSSSPSDLIRQAHLELLVPSCCRKHLCPIHVNEFDTFDRGVVYRDLLRRRAAGVQVVHPRSVVAPGRDQLHTGLDRVSARDPKSMRPNSLLTMSGRGLGLRASTSPVLVIVLSCSHRITEPEPGERYSCLLETQRTLLSQLATARISCVGLNSISDTESPGGLASSMSFGPATAGLYPPNMLSQASLRRASPDL